MAKARGRYLGMDLEIISPDEAAKLFPLMDKKHFLGAIYDPIEGHIDPYGVHACIREIRPDWGCRDCPSHTGYGSHLKTRWLLGCDYHTRQTYTPSMWSMLVAVGLAK